MSATENKTISSSCIPEWLDDIFVQKCLQNHFPEKEINNVRFTASPATGKGENFLSDIIRLEVAYTDGKGNSDELHSMKVICKLSLDDPELLAEVADLNVYKKEKEMYENILPKLTAMLDEDEKVFADTIYVSHEHDAIIFEDLLESGYSIDKTKRGFDLEHTKLVLTKVAKFHAANAVLEEKDARIYQTFRRGLFSDNSSWLSKLYEAQLDAIINVVDSWNDYQYYAEKLRKLRPKLIQKCIENFDPSPSHFNTLLHGDLWTNNIMLSYNKKSKQLVNAALIDLQLCRWTSPTLDLHHFFNTSLEEDLRLHHQEELVQFYYNELARTLERLHYKKTIPTLHEFYIQFIEKDFFAFTSALINQPFMIHEGDVSADTQSLMADDQNAESVRNCIMSDRKVQANLRKLLPIFDRRGLLD